MEAKERLESLCAQALEVRGLGRHAARLQEELREIHAQNEEEYVLGLVEKDTRYPENPNNLFVYYLLGVVRDWDETRPPEYVQGEFPDIDIDYLAPVREYIRQEWAPKYFGEDRVCAIGNYNTFGLKSSFLDMARVFGNDLKEINVITKSLGAKDEDGKTLTFSKAKEEYPELRSYCEHYPDVGQAVERILHRNKAMGTHAGGLVISSRRIDDFVPLVRGKDDAITSAWTEGLHGQDLGPMGLIKFDILGITDLMRIALACKLVKERHGLAHICSDPLVNRDWSDTSYLNDPTALELANRGDLLGIFQFDSSGIRKLCKESGVTSFDDLVAYSALYRPGPLGQGMHTVYANRKNGRDDDHHDLHPILRKILGKTYGVMVYQEQVMQILHAVGDIPLKDCEAVRKAISKKKVDKFIKYKELFVQRGQEKLGWSAAAVEDLWKQIESFAEYGFNKSHSVAYTYISSRLLYLKAHYPLEFYCATLTCEKTSDKIKEYKRDAVSHGRNIQVVPVDINKSKDGFHIDGDKIYYGLADLKGIGDDVARRIVEGQPYTDFQDFLTRFGMDANVVKPLVELGIFGMDRDRKWRYYEKYKDSQNKAVARDKRFLESKAKFRQRVIDELAGTGYVVECDWDDLDQLEKDLTDFSRHFADDRSKSIRKAMNSYIRCVAGNAAKVAGDKPPDLYAFDLGSIEKAEDAWTFVEKAIALSEAEEKYYGFRWTHPLELSRRYSGDRTFECFRRAVDNGEPEFYVEVVVRSCEERMSKKGRPYHSITIEDSNSESQRMNIWDEDWARFGNLLSMWVDPEADPENPKDPRHKPVGNMLRMCLVPPDPKFPMLNMKSWPRHLYSRMAPKDVSMDFRVSVMEMAKDWSKW